MPTTVNSPVLHTKSPQFAGNKKGPTPGSILRAVGVGLLAVTGGSAARLMPTQSATSIGIQGNATLSGPPDRFTRTKPFDPSILEPEADTLSDASAVNTPNAKTNRRALLAPATKTTPVHDLSELTKLGTPLHIKPQSVELDDSSAVRASAASATTPLTNAQALAILKRKVVFKATVPSMFTVPGVTSKSSTSPTTSTQAATTTPAPTDAQLKTQLTSILTKRLGSATSAAAAVKLMDDPQFKKVVPNSNLRAALINLTGTAGAGAITSVKKGIFGTIDFFTGFDGPTDIAVSGRYKGASSSTAAFNNLYRNADFRQLTPVVAHEIMHSDNIGSTIEEVTAYSAVHTMVYGQLLLEDPKLALKITPGQYLTQFNNLMLYARVNSRDAQGNLRILSSIPPQQSFVSGFHGDFSINTPGNSYMRGVLSKITGIPVAKLANANFDNSTLKLIDQNQKLLSPVQLVKIAQALKLNLNPTA